MPWIAVIFVVVAAGAAAALQAQFMGEMTSRMGTLESMFITYGLGGLVIAGIMAANRGGNLVAWRSVPWWFFTAGLAGLVIVGGLGVGASRIGLVATVSVSVATSFAVSAAIDHYGWLGAEIRPLDVGRMLGMALLFAGAWLIIR